MIKGSIHQENKHSYMCGQQKTASKYMEQKLMELKGKVGNHS